MFLISMDTYSFQGIVLTRCLYLCFFSLRFFSCRLNIVMNYPAAAGVCVNEVRIGQKSK